jgi:peroxiredoxin Q/BCP
MMPSVGDKAPSFPLKDGEGHRVKLSDFKSKKVVLYFYPRDMTPGCTKEACSFQTDLPKFERKEVVVLGVSTDDARSHQKFSEKYGLKFPLLSDADHKIADLYGIWQEKNMYGKKVWGMKRTTFIIDENGKIAHVFKKVTPDIHSHEVLESLANLDKKG